jgi:hypothetical protein
MSGALTIIHSKLGCEQYQAECKKLLSFYRGMAEERSALCSRQELLWLASRMDDHKRTEARGLMPDHVTTA